MKNISKKEYDQLIISGKKFAVMFGAKWCRPCLSLKPVVEQVAALFEGNTEVFYVDCDEDAEIAGDLKVQAIPTIVFLTNGKEYDRLIGVSSENKIIEKMNI